MSTLKVAELLREAAARLPGEDARHEAEQLLIHVLGVERAWLFSHATDEVDADAVERFEVLLARRAEGHPLAYLTACQHLLKPGGLMVCSTLNRNPKSFMMAIVGAEWVMRWLPKGTHDWAKFITPDELYDLIRRAGLDPVDKRGMVFNPVSWRWSLSDRDLSVNYVTASVKR